MNIEDRINKYKAKMRLMYGCDIEIKIEDDRVIFKRLVNYTDRKLIVPNFITDIGKDLLRYCNTIEEVILGENTKVIEECAFYHCGNLEYINLENVEIIGASAFLRCRKLRDIDLNRVVYIGGHAFEECNNLTDVSMQRIERMGTFVFNGCFKLNKVVFSKHIRRIEKCTFAYCVSLKDIEGKAINSIMESAFESSGIDGTIIERGIKYIGEHAFYDCNNIKNLNLSGVEECMSAFSLCNNIESIKLPDKIKLHKGIFDDIGIDVNIDSYNIRYLDNDMMELSKKEK